MPIDSDAVFRQLKIDLITETDNKLYPALNWFKSLWVDIKRIEVNIVYNDTYSEYIYHHGFNEEDWLFFVDELETILWCNSKLYTKKLEQKFDIHCNESIAITQMFLDIMMDGNTDRKLEILQGRQVKFCRTIFYSL